MARIVGSNHLREGGKFPSCTRIPWEQASLAPETSLFLPKQSTAPQGNQANRLILSPLNQFSGLLYEPQVLRGL
jgi:hypothetical protein